MPLITTNPGMRISEERLERQFRSLCRTPKSNDDDPLDGKKTSNRQAEKPFGFMYNLFFWAVMKGTNDGAMRLIGGKTEVPFRWLQIPSRQQTILQSVALYRIISHPEPEKERSNAEAFLSQSEEEISEQLREVLEQLAESGLQLMDEEVELDSPDAYRTVPNLVETIEEGYIIE